MSEKRDTKWGERVAQFSGVACVAAVITSIWPGWPWIINVLSKDGAPAWVQAIGSVAAIVSGVWVVLYQLESQRSEAKNNAASLERARVSSASQILLGRTISILLTLRSIENKMLRAQPQWKSLAKTAQHISDIMDQVPISEFPTPWAAAMFTSLRVPLSGIAQILHECAEVDAIPDGGVSRELFDKVKSQVRNLLESAEKSNEWLAKETASVKNKDEHVEMERMLDYLMKPSE